MAREWTDAEDAVLRRMLAAGMSFDAAATALARTPAACISRSRALAPKRTESRAGSLWTPEEDAVLKQCVRCGGTWEQAASRLPGRTACACHARAKLVGLQKPRPRREEKPPPLPLKPAMRRCHDCGRPTPDYRCPKCLEKWRAKHGVPPSGAGEPEGYPVFGGAHGFD